MTNRNKIYRSGFQRSNADDKIRYDLIPTSILTRLAMHYTNGAKQYGEGNWLKVQSPEEMHRFKESAWRHFIAWQENQNDEDHAMALIWNVMSYEYKRTHD